MADTKISDLADGAPVEATDEFVVARASTNKKITFADLEAGLTVVGMTELDYAQITSDVTVNGSSGSPNTAITGAAIAYDGSTDIYIEFFTASLVPGSAALIVEVYEDSTSLGRVCQTGSASGNHPAFGSVRRTPSAATHTYSIRAWKNGGTDGSISAASGTYTPAFMRVLRVG